MHIRHVILPPVFLRPALACCSLSMHTLICPVSYPPETHVRSCSHAHAHLPHSWHLGKREGKASHPNPACNPPQSSAHPVYVSSWRCSMPLMQVGIHERSAREKISHVGNSSGSAHIMNDEATRKYFQVRQARKRDTACILLCCALV